METTIETVPISTKKRVATTTEGTTRDMKNAAKILMHRTKEKLPLILRSTLFLK